LKHVGANSVTSVTAYVILYSYIQVHKLVQIESICVICHRADHLQFWCEGE